MADWRSVGFKRVDLELAMSTENMVGALVGDGFVWWSGGLGIEALFDCRVEDGFEFFFLDNASDLGSEEVELVSTCGKWVGTCEIPFFLKQLSALSEAIFAWRGEESSDPPFDLLEIDIACGGRHSGD